MPNFFRSFSSSLMISSERVQRVKSSELFQGRLDVIRDFSVAQNYWWLEQQIGETSFFFIIVDRPRAKKKFNALRLSTSRWQPTSTQLFKFSAVHIRTCVCSVRVFALHLVCHSDEGKRPCQDEEGCLLAKRRRRRRR